MQLGAQEVRTYNEMSLLAGGQVNMAARARKLLPA